MIFQNRLFSQPQWLNYARDRAKTKGRFPVNGQSTALEKSAQVGGTKNAPLWKKRVRGWRGAPPAAR